MKGLKIGGLALLVKANYRENIGKVVEIFDFDGVKFGIQFKDETKMVNTYTGLYAGKDTKGWVAPSWLKPLEDIKYKTVDLVDVSEKLYESI